MSPATWSPRNNARDRETVPCTFHEVGDTTVLFRFQELGGHNREFITGTLNSDNKGLKGLNNPVLFYTLWCYVIHCSKKFFY